MKKNCLNCGDPLVMKVNVRTPNALFCNKPECLKARDEYNTARRKAYQESRRKKWPEKYCKHCNTLLTRENANNTLANYCNKPECQEARNQDKARQVAWHNKQRRKNGSRNTKRRPYKSRHKGAGGWTYYKTGVCATCGKTTRLNRVSQCKQCRARALEGRVSGNWMYVSMDDI